MTDRQSLVRCFGFPIIEEHLSPHIAAKSVLHDIIASLSNLMRLRVIGILKVFRIRTLSTRSACSENTMH